MGRLSRSERVLPGFPNHVIVRGNNRRRLFSYPRDRHKFIRLLGKGLQKHDCLLNAASLLSNHVHLIVVPSSVDALSACMKFMNWRYALYRNRTMDGTGKVFEERFWSKPITSARQLAITTLYVDLNETSAGVAPYRGREWSTRAFHCGRADNSWLPLSLWTPSSWYENLGTTATNRQEGYQEWTAVYLEQQLEREVECHIRENASWPARPDGRRAT